MNQGRGGMGSHKHGVSGRAPRSPAYKQIQTREANRLAEQERANRVRPVTYGSIQELMDRHR